MEIPAKVRSLRLLVAVPTTCALLPWFVLPAMPNDPVDNHVPVAWLVTDGSLPLVGVLVVVAFAVRYSLIAPLLPLLPFGFAALSYLGTAILISLNNDDSLGWVSDVFLVSIACFALQPFLAVIGGLASVGALERRRRRSMMT